MASSSGDFGNEVIPETEREWLAGLLRRERGPLQSHVRTACRMLAHNKLGPIRADSTLHGGWRSTNVWSAKILMEMRLSDEAWTSPKVRGYDLESALSVRNMVLLGRILATAASGRTENRGAHFLLDFPETENARWRVVTRLESGAGGGIEFHKHSLKQST
jgi:succinate dehydrogenase/fumarate reductase flavoprotein subunit